MEENRKLTEEAQKPQEAVAQTEATPQEETPEQINWKKFREKREEERKIAEKRIAEEKERAEKATAEAKALKDAIDAIISREGDNVQEISPGNNGDDSERISQLVGKELERVDREREQKRIQQEAKEWPQRLVREIPDFDRVCTTENLDYLEYHHPEIAEAFKEAPDGYNKWKNVYSVLKKMIPNPSSDKDEKRMERNLAKPRSISTPGLPSTGDMAPHLLDDSRKKANWQRMQQVMRGA
jgi:hypothetical protein